MRADEEAGPQGRRARALGEVRDQAESPFAGILASLLGRVPGARAAALVDADGETVDYAGRAPPFDLRVMAAQWRVTLNAAREQRSLRSVDWLVVGAARRSYLVHALPDGYALVLQLAPRAGFVGWHRAVAMCISELRAEAGWSGGPSVGLLWRPVRIRSDERGRPRAVRIGTRTHPIEILGRIVRERAGTDGPTGPAGGGGERGWRVRVPTVGIEITLLREPGGAWFADELLE